MIPKNIIQTYISYDKIPNKYLEYVKKIKELHPDYNYMFFNDNDIDNFIKTKYPNFIEIYNNFKYNIQRIDLFRLLAIYEFGGFYIDIDVEILKPLDNLLQYNIIFPIEYNIEYVFNTLQKGRLQDILNKIKLQSFSDQLGQYAFGSIKKHNFIEHFISHIINNPIPKNELINSNKEEYIYCTTGPRLLTLSYMLYPYKNDIMLLSPTKFEIHKFGDYGTHDGIGSWK
tara:strand:- start:55 stop:738 length:684 start_codon:yes stop_codon:yes gene_type:complete